MLCKYNIRNRIDTQNMLIRNRGGAYLSHMILTHGTKEY